MSQTPDFVGMHGLDTMVRMHVDHLAYAVGDEGLQATVERLEGLLGGHFRDGGIHPRFGTRNHILPLADSRYLEVVEVLDHPAAEKAVYGQAVRARSAMGGGWLAWVISVENLNPYEERLERKSVPGSRLFPDGRRLEWEQIGMRGLMVDPQLPYFIKWESEPDILPSALPGEITLSGLEIAGNKKRVEDWVGVGMNDDGQLDGVTISFTSENGHPGLNAATFTLKDGSTVRL